MKIIDGKKIAEGIIAELKKRPAPRKFLAALMVGSDPATESFVRQKEKIAKELGVDFRITRCVPDIAERELVDEIRKYADDEQCGGIILQLPLPAHLDRAQVIAAIPPEKDVDALRGEGPLTPPAAGVVQEILRIENCKIENCRVAVVGMGFLVGRPIARWFKQSVRSQELAEVMTLDIGDDLGKIKDADVVVLGAGKAGFVKPAMLKSGALVIDFGYSRNASGALLGDFDASQPTNQSTNELINYTPTPGGTGPLLVAKLFENFYQLNR